MADNVTYTAGANSTPPNATLAATDELSDGSHAGIAKIAISADGDRTLIPATAADGLLVEVSNAGSITFGGLTDAELRATPVPVSGTVTATGPLTDAQLRATPVPVDVDAPVGQAAMAASIPVVIASNQSTVPVSTASLPLPTGAATLAEQQTQTTALQIMDDWDESDRAKVNPIVGQAGVAAGTGVDGATVQRVSLATNVPLPAGTNNIGDVDVLSSALPTGAATLAEQQTQTASLSVLDDWDETNRAAVNTIAGQVGVAGGSGTDSALTQRVSLATNVALPAGTNNIGDVDVLTMPVTEVVGDVAADAAVPANPLAVGGRASDALPTEVSADGDSVYEWLLRNGAAMTAQLPHLGLIADPYTHTSETAQYTTTQTSTILSAVGTGQTMAVTYIQIQAGATTAGTVQVYFGDGSYNRGNSLAIFDGEFAPSATLKPGFTASPSKPWIGPINEDLRVTTSANITVTVTVWYYLI